MTEGVPLQQVDRTCVRTRGRKLDYFSGCDYFRLASHPRVISAAGAALRRFGLNVAASRVTTGNHSLYSQLERELARFFDAETAVLLPTGYVSGLTVAQALKGEFTHAFIDERAHVCLLDAAAFLGCPVRTFKHLDTDDLARAVRACGGDRPLVLTDGMFARDGAVAPLRDYLAVLPKRAWLLVDDSHGAGVVGATGRGSLEQTGVDRRRIIQTITLSKAFGAYGGAVLTTREFRARIVAASRLFPGSTPLPLPLANAALAAVKLLTGQPAFLRRLRRNTEFVRAALRSVGVPAPDLPGPIVLLPPMSPRRAARLRRALLAAGIYPPLIRYPGAPAGGYFRFVISSEHSAAQLENLAAVLTLNLAG